MSKDNAVAASAQYVRYGEARRLWRLAGTLSRYVTGAWKRFDTSKYYDRGEVVLRNLLWGILAGSWAAFGVCAGIALFSLFIGQLRAEIASAEPRLLIGIPTGLFTAGVIAGVARPLLRRPSGEYVLGGLAAVGFFTAQFTVGKGLSWWNVTAGPIMVLGVFLVGVLMTPLFRYGFRVGHLPIPNFDRFLDTLWHAPVKPADDSRTDAERDQS